jgi:FlaA1/EpsC-like NDP-sugar epimerase
MPPGIRRLALQRSARVFDLLFLGVTFVASLAMASGALTWPSLANVLAMRITLGNLILIVIYFAICAGIFSAYGMYRSHRLSGWKRRVREILLAVTLITAILLLVRGPLELSFASNKFLLIFWSLLLAVFVVAHETAQQLLFYARSRGRNIRNIVIVGERREATDLAERFEKDSNFGYRVLDIIDPGGGVG